MRLETHDAFTNMAIDEALMESVRAGKSPPTIRFYRWNPNAVSIGTFQSMNKEVNVPKCKELGVDCVRRLTGGGAVFHDYAGEVTYSVVGPLSCFPQGIRESYKYVCNWVVSGLRRIGIESSFVPINDILVEGKKISGNAQTRREGVLLQHGTVIYDANLANMFKVLNVSPEKLSDKMVKSAEERVTSVAKHSSASMDELSDALIEGFTEGKDHDFGGLAKEESLRADELARTAYRTDAWNFSR